MEFVLELVPGKERNNIAGDLRPLDVEFINLFLLLFFEVLNNVVGQLESVL